MEIVDLSNFDLSNIDENDMANYGYVFGRSIVGKIIISKSQKKKVEIICEHIDSYHVTYV